MEHKLSCPNCQQRVAVPDELLGTTIQCPSCANSMVLKLTAVPPNVPLSSSKQLEQTAKRLNEMSGEERNKVIHMAESAYAKQSAEKQISEEETVALDCVIEFVDSRFSAYTSQGTVIEELVAFGVSKTVAAELVGGIGRVSGDSSWPSVLGQTIAGLTACFIGVGLVKGVGGFVLSVILFMVLKIVFSAVFEALFSSVSNSKSKR